MKKETFYLILSISVIIIALSFAYSKIYLEPKYKNIELAKQQEKTDLDSKRYIKECEEEVDKKYEPQLSKLGSHSGEISPKEFDTLSQYWSNQIEIEKSECKKYE